MPAPQDLDALQADASSSASSAAALPSANPAESLPSTSFAMVATATTTVALLGALMLTVNANADGAAGPAAASAPAKAALTVTTTALQSQNLPRTLGANGSVAAWQEASIGSPSNGLQLLEVLVNVGDVVQRGQLLARFDAASLRADLAQAQAALAEAQASALQAKADAERARELSSTGALSAQQIELYLSTEAAAKARVAAQTAQVQAQTLRLKHAEVRSPDAGVITHRSATVGAVTPAGQELFRLIRQQRLEWRAELPSSELGRVKVGGRVTVLPAGGGQVAGTVRQVAPTVDARTRNALVYVDLAPGSSARAGMFATGSFELGGAEVQTLPQSAVVLRDGFSTVMKLGMDQKVVSTKVVVGQRFGDLVEIREGLSARDQVVASGAGFLSDGDTVRVVPGAPAAPAKPQPAAR